MKFVLFSVTKAMWDKRELFNYYVEKLRENGYIIEKDEWDNYIIQLDSFTELVKMADIIEQYDMVIHLSTKGDEPCLEIYDDYRE